MNCDKHNLPVDTCGLCHDQSDAAKFERRYEALKENYDRVLDRLNEYEEDAKAVGLENCDDRQHCSCVVHLRRQLREEQEVAYDASVEASKMRNALAAVCIPSHEVPLGAIIMGRKLLASEHIGGYVTLSASDVGLALDGLDAIEIFAGDNTPASLRKLRTLLRLTGVK